jgi:arylsulfatase A-like enzyme
MARSCHPHARPCRDRANYIRTDIARPSASWPIVYPPRVRFQGPGGRALRLAAVLAALAGVVALAACRRGPPRPPSGPPNVVVLLGDTVRRDAVGCYGAGEHATPAIDALAAAGARFEQARAQASWTLPSVASVFTSRWCHEVTDWADLPQRLPDEAVTMAELFRAKGYATAGFSANVLVNRDDGFAQGFDEFWAPPAEASMWTDALTTADRAAAWLKAHAAAKPFFLYVHFVDPHSPYCPPDKRPKDPNAPIPGDMSLSFYGKKPLPDGPTIAEWRRLYAEEVALVDRGVDRVLAGLPFEVRRNTYVVFLADHGEEFFDHGFLGHGWSLYEELLRVPLVMSGPAIPAGRVVREPVGLIDLLPTLADLARLDAGGARSSWRGISLRAALAGAPAPLDRTFLAETYHYGPLRVAVQRGMTQAIFFNRGPGDAPPVTERTFGEERVKALLPREALFDLLADPLEKGNLAKRPDAGPALAAARDVVLRSLAQSLPGRWVAVRGPGNGGRLEGAVRYGAKLERLVPFFLRDGETVTFRRDTVSVSLVDDGSVRAWLVPDRTDIPVANAQLRAGGLPLASVSEDALAKPGWASWTAAPRRPASRPADAAEQVRRLKALGYLQ